MHAWYVAATLPGEGLRAEEHLDRQGFQSFNPLCATTKIVRGARVIRQTPYIPGYIFVRFDVHEDPWRKIYSTRGIKTLLGGNPERPTPVREDAMAILLDKCNGKIVKAEHVDAALSRIVPVGSTVRIVEGPFNGHEAKVTWSHDDRVTAIMSLFGRPCELKLRSSDVQMVA